MSDSLPIRFVLYAKTLGRTPEEQIEIEESKGKDRFREFAEWGIDRVIEWEELNRIHLFKNLSNQELIEFEEWLRLKVERNCHE